MMKLVMILIAGLAGLYGLLVLFVYYNQASLLFLPHIPERNITRTPDHIHLKYEEIILHTRDQQRLLAWWVPHPQAAGTILFFHGNAGNIGHRLETLQTFHELGYNVFMPEYRGYGQSSGKPSEAGLYLDADSAWQYLTNHRKIPASQIIIAGRSLGAAVALYLAEQQPARAVLIESAFTSVPDMATLHYPWLPVRWLSKFEFDNRARIGKVRSPILIVHSQDDEITPYTHAQQLYALAGQPKHLLELQGGHNESLYVSYGKYRDGLRQFLSTLPNDKHQE